MTVATDERTRDVIIAALDRSGLSLRQFAARLGTSPARMSAYVHGRTTPSAALLLRMVDLAGVDFGFRAGRIGATAVAEAIDADGAAHPSDALRWLIEGRDHLLEMSDLEAGLKWGRPRNLPSDPRWATLMKAVAAAAFQSRGEPLPDWVRAFPLEEQWQPLRRLPVLDRDADPALDRLNIRVRTKDLTTK